jgi:hypothetical protein
MTKTTIPKTVALRGRAGERGPVGQRGPVGERGPAGASVSRDDILAVVADQFEAMTKRLDAQLELMNQMQQELIGSRKETVEVRLHLEEVHDLVKALVASTKD